MNNATVVNLYKEAYDVYIGRPGKGKDGTFGNPFYQFDTETNIKKFKEYFYKRVRDDLEFKHQVLRLRGKRLGCFCHPKPCHGDIIADYLNKIVPLKYAVIGSRTFCDYEFLNKILDFYDISTIISGGAKGADSLAKQYGNKKGIQVKEFLPQWDLYGKSAGFIRNKLIINECDEVIAFWDRKSNGTKHSINLAKENNKPLSIYWPPEQEIDKIALLGL